MADVAGDSARAWSLVGDFAAVCRDVGAFGIEPSEWGARVDALLDALPLDELLGLLSSAKDDAQVEDMCLVLKHVLQRPRVTGALVDDKFLPALQGGLAHPSDSVRGLTAKQLRIIGLDAFANASGLEMLVGCVAARLYDRLTGVAVDAESALVALGGSRPRLVLQSLSTVLGAQDHGQGACDESTAEVRVMSTVARLSAGNDRALAVAQELGLAQKLLDMVGGDDVLLQLNVLRLVPLLSTTKAGLGMLTAAGVVAQLSHLAGIGSQAQAADPILGDEALKVVAQLAARTVPSQDSGDDLSDLFLRAMKLRLEARSAGGGSEAETAATLSLMGAFAGAQPPSSLELLTQRQAVLQPWIKLAAAAQTEATGVAGLRAMADALRGGAAVPESSGGAALVYFSPDGSEYAALLDQSRARPSAAERAKAAELARPLFVVFGDAVNQRTRALPVPALTSASDAVNVIVKLLDKPFDETKCAAYALLAAVAAQDARWGLEAIYAAGCDVEQALMDRSVAMNKQAKEWRFAVLEAVFHNPHRDAVLGPQRKDLLSRFLQRGAYAGPNKPPAPRVELAGA